MRWSNKSGYKYDINLCFYGKEKPTPYWRAKLGHLTFTNRFESST